MFWFYKGVSVVIEYVDGVCVREVNIECLLFFEDIFFVGRLVVKLFLGCEFGVLMIG